MTPREKFEALRQAYLAADAAYDRAARARRQAMDREDAKVLEAIQACNPIFEQIRESKIAGPWIEIDGEPKRLDATGDAVARVWQREPDIIWSAWVRAHGTGHCATRQGAMDRCDQTLINAGYTLLDTEDPQHDTP